MVRGVAHTILFGVSCIDSTGKFLFYCIPRTKYWHCVNTFYWPKYDPNGDFVCYIRSANNGIKVQYTHFVDCCCTIVGHQQNPGGHILQYYSLQRRRQITPMPAREITAQRALPLIQWCASIVLQLKLVVLSTQLLLTMSHAFSFVKYGDKGI